MKKKGKVTEAMRDIIYHRTIKGDSAPSIAKDLGLNPGTIVNHRKDMRIEQYNGFNF